MEQSILNAAWIFGLGFFIGLVVLLIGSFPKAKDETSDWTKKASCFMGSTMTLLFGFFLCAVTGFMLFICLLIDASKQ